MPLRFKDMSARLSLCVCVPIEDEAKATATIGSDKDATLNVGVTDWVRLGDLKPGTIFILLQLNVKYRINWRQLNESTKTDHT